MTASIVLATATVLCAALVVWLIHGAVKEADRPRDERDEVLGFAMWMTGSALSVFVLFLAIATYYTWGRL